MLQGCSKINQILQLRALVGPGMDALRARWTVARSSYARRRAVYCELRDEIVWAGMCLLAHRQARRLRRIQGR